MTAAFMFFFRANRWAQIAGAVVLALLIFGVWLLIHDRGIREAERARIEAHTAKESQKAEKRADVKQEKRNEAFERSQRDLLNASSPDDWARRLHEIQCRDGKIKAPC